MDTSKEPKLYGIHNSNRSNSDLWGKNQFNSSFPVALICFMKDNNIKPVYLTLDNRLNVIATEIDIKDLFNTNKENEDIYFSFESKFDPFQKFAHDDIGGIDLVVKDTAEKFLRPLEIKLTVLPDNSTCDLEQENWGSELVIRPATTKYGALAIAASCENHFEFIRNELEPICHDIRDWGNQYEMIAKLEQLLDKLDIIQKKFLSHQIPMLVQPIWKTKGKSPILGKNAFEVFVWSNFALSRLFLDNSRNSLGGDSINRQMRSSARLARFLYEVSTRGKANLRNIYTEMTFGLQTDKEFAVNGRITRAYMNSPHIITPRVVQ